VLARSRNETMKRSFIFALTAVLLSACDKSIKEGVSYPTFLPTPMVTPTLSIGFALTNAKPDTSTSSPSSTSAPSSGILADFPLSVGTVWKYSGEIIYQDPKDNSKTDTWNGIITDTVIVQMTMPDGKVGFTVQESIEPMPPDGVWRQSGNIDYILLGNGIFRDGWEIYRWPLSDTATWEAGAGTGYEMEAKYVGEVDVPYGKQKGCYTLLLATLPDATLDTFCPGIGIVEHKYQHNGDRQDEHFVLISYEPVQ
jgi:hypothetical protein